MSFNDFSEKFRENILLHNHFEGCIEIANPKGVIISSQGAKPRGMKLGPEGLGISMHPEK